MSCSNCYNFVKTKSPADLGDINNSDSCAYCLYWYAGPGSDRNCDACDTVFENVSNMGTKFDVNSYNIVNSCLNIPNNKENCSHLYTQFNNPPQPNQNVRNVRNSRLGGGRFKDFAQENILEYGSLNPCTGKLASPGFSNIGVL